MNTIDLQGVLCLLLAFVVLYLFGMGFARIMRRMGITLEQPRKFPRKEEKVKAHLEFYSRKDGWHVTFNLGYGVCYGILTNVYEGEGKEGDVLEASLLCAPDSTCGFYRLFALDV